MPIINLTYDDLPPIVSILEDALFNRPDPSGEEYYDVDSAILNAYDYSYALDILSEDNAQLDAWDFKNVVQNMADGYKKFWEKSFPAGQEAGQLLFSAILEKPMKDLLRNLKQILKDKNFDNDRPLINIDAEKEVDAFYNWLNSLKKKSNYCDNSSDLGCMLAAGLFGYWLGKS